MKHISESHGTSEQVVKDIRRATTKNVNIDSEKSVTPETDTAKSLLLTGLAAFGGVNLLN